MLTRSLLRWFFILWPLTGALLLLVLLGGRWLHDDPPPLLYSRFANIYLRRLGCADWVAPCRPDETPLLAQLDPLQAYAQWSPDGSTIAAHYRDGWRLYEAACLLSRADPRTCPAQPLAPDRQQDASIRLAWGPDGSAVAYITHSGTQVNLRTSGCWTDDDPTLCQTWHVPVNPGIFLLQPAWSADGTRLVFAGQPGGLYTLDADCAVDIETCGDYFGAHHLNGLYFHFPSLSADGTRAVAAAQAHISNTRIVQVDLTSGTVTPLTDGRINAVLPDWSRDERYVAYAAVSLAADPVNLDIHVYDLMRRRTVQITHSRADESYPAWGTQGGGTVD